MNQAKSKKMWYMYFLSQDHLMFNKWYRNLCSIKIMFYLHYFYSFDLRKYYSDVSLSPNIFYANFKKNTYIYMILRSIILKIKFGVSKLLYYIQETCLNSIFSIHYLKYF